MNNKYKVSVIIPTFKRVEKLRRAIDSVIAQTINSWEIIVVDNHSNDGTLELVKSYKKKNINFYLIKNNGNIAKSRNLGIIKSKGNYIALLDSDDSWVPEKLEECLKRLNKKTKLVYHELYIQKKINQFFFKKSGLCRNLKKPVFYDLIYNGPAFPTSSVVVEKKILKKINFFCEKKNHITWEDYDAWIRLSKISNGFKKIDKILGYRFVDKENMLVPKLLIKSIFEFKKKYLHKAEFPNWCKIALIKSYFNSNQKKKFDFMFKQINFKKIRLKEKIRIIMIFLIVKLKEI